MRRKITVFTGAGVSADSGIQTFRDAGGLWENFRIEEVATPEAFAENPKKVLDFYNRRFEQLKEVEPNAAHHAIAELEKHFEVVVITQNVDNLHERAGSSRIIHLHGELSKCRSTYNPGKLYPMPPQGLKPGDLAPDGGQLRPHIVWFGELVPAMDEAAEAMLGSDYLMIVGTSLQVYPAAGLAYMADPSCRILLVDPAEAPSDLINRLKHYQYKAAIGVPKCVEDLLEGRLHG